MKYILPQLISKEQDGFVGRKQITYGIIQMHEILHSCHKKNEATIICDLDMEKTQDRVNQVLLDKVLHKFRLGARWRNKIKECITTPRFSMLVNGEAKRFFGSERGLRQGDLKSPYMFIHMVEALRRTINKAKENHLVKGSILATNCQPTTHHQFVDDIIIIGKVEVNKAKQYKNILTLYEKDFHQKINYQK